MAFGDGDGPPVVTREMFVLPPKVLLFWNEKEEDEWRDRMIDLLIKYLAEKHIGYTTDFNDMQIVSLSILFINKSFVRNCTHFFDIFRREKYRSRMKFTAVFYENHESPLVLDISTEYPHFGYEVGQENEKIDKEVHRRWSRLLSCFISGSNVDFGTVPFSNDWNDIENAIGAFVVDVVNDLNPFALDFSQFRSDFLSHIVDMSYNLYSEVVVKPRRDGPSLIAIFEGCSGSCCQLNIILKLVWTLVNHRSHYTFDYCLHLTKFQLNECESPSLFNVFLSEMTRKHRCSMYAGGYVASTYFVVIDGLENFLTREEDNPALLLANFANRLGKGSLIVAISTTSVTTRLPEHPTIQMQTWGHVRGTKCINSPPSTIERPACLTILNSQLNELILKPEVSGTDPASEIEEEEDQMDMCSEDDTKKNSHSIDFEIFGSAQKKFKDA